MSATPLLSPLRLKFNNPAILRTLLSTLRRTLLSILRTLLSILRMRASLLPMKILTVTRPSNSVIYPPTPTTSSAIITLQEQCSMLMRRNSGDWYKSARTHWKCWTGMETLDRTHPLKLLAQCCHHLLQQNLQVLTSCHLIMMVKLILTVLLRRWATKELS